MLRLERQFIAREWTCHGKNGPPQIGSPRNKFFDKYGPPRTYFTAKYGLPLKNLDHLPQMKERRH